MDRNIRTVDDVLRLLDGLFAPEADRWTANAGSSWWDSFYADRSKPVPFFVAKPDENLVSYLDRSMITPGRRALDLGCGSAVWLPEGCCQACLLPSDPWHHGRPSLGTILRLRLGRLASTRSFPC